MSKQIAVTKIRRTAFAMGLALVLGACGQAIADGPESDLNGPTTTPAPTSTTTIDADGPGTTEPPPSTADVVSVPDLSGLTVADARALLTSVGLEMRPSPYDVGSGIVVAQNPAPATEAEEGSVVVVDVQLSPTCNPPDPTAPGAGQVIITVLYECGNDDVMPTPGIGVARIVPEQGGEAIDRIEWTLRSLLAGPTDDEKIAGFVSGFDAATADAMDSVTLTGGRLVVDFNDAIVVNNMSTATGMVQFHADLHRNVFQHPEVDSVEFHFGGDCEAWSALFESDGCRVTTRADWYQDLIEWDELRNQ